MYVVAMYSNVREQSTRGTDAGLPGLAAVDEMASRG